MTARTLGEFRIERELGRGGFGVVYAATDTRTGRTLALKVYHEAFGLDAAARARLGREARSAARLDHPHILPIHRMGEIDGVPFLAMDLVEGGSVDRVLDLLRARPLAGIRRSTFLAAVEANLRGASALPDELPQGEGGDGPHADAAAWIALQAARALAATHEAGIVHRDIKPANLLLRRDGHLFVADFGLAKDETLATLTRTGEFRGTPRYMSPEQLLAERRAVDERTDVYSLGATLYELLALRPPFAGEVHTELVRAIAFQTPPRVERLNPTVPRDLAVIVHKCLEKDPAQRYATMGGLADDLDAFLAHRAIAARPVGLVGRATRAIRRRPVRALLVTAVLMSSLVGGAHVVRDVREARAAQRSEAELREQSAVRRRAAIEVELERGAVLDAAAACAALADTAGSSPELTLLQTRVRGAAGDRLRELADNLTRPLLGRVPESVLADDEEADRLLDGVHGLREDLDTNPALAEKLAAGQLRAEAVREAVAFHPAARDLFHSEEANVRAALASVWQYVTRPERLRWRRAARATELRPGVDVATIHVPSTSRNDRNLSLPASAVVFGGYAIDSAQPVFHDLSGVDVRDRVVLCFRRCPGHGTPTSPFGDFEGRDDHPSRFVSKARFAQRLGARALLVVNQRQQHDEPTLVSSRAGLGADIAIPVLQVTRDIAKAWFAAAGLDLDLVQDDIDTRLAPRVCDLGDLGIETTRDALPECLLPVLTELLDDRRGGGRDSYPTHDTTLGGSALSILLALEGPAVDEILERAFAKWVAAGGAILSTPVHRVGEAGDPAPVPKVIAIAASGLERRRGWLGPAVQATLSGWTGAVPQQLWYLGQLTPNEPFSEFSGQGLRAWFQSFQQGSAPRQLGARGLLWRVTDGGSPFDYLLACLWCHDPEAAIVAARQLRAHARWTAATVLAYAGTDADRAELANAAKQAMSSMLTGGSMARFQSSFAIAAVEGLSARAHPGGDALTIDMLRQELADVYRIHLADLMTCLGRYADSGLGVDELMRVVALEVDRDGRPGGLPTQALDLLLQPARRTAFAQALAAILAQPASDTTLRVLDALRWRPDRGPLAAEVVVLLDAARRHSEPRIAARACLTRLPTTPPEWAEVDDALTQVGFANEWLTGLVAATPSTSPAILELLGRHCQDARQLNSAAWRFVRQPGLPAASYEAALSVARRAAELTAAPNNLNTLGVAQYRCGQFAEAAATLAWSMQSRREAGQAQSPIDLAFLALCQHALDQPDQAAATFAVLEACMRELGREATSDDRAAREEVRAALGK